MGRLREHSHGGIIGDREYSQSLSQGYKGLAHAKTCFLNPHDFANFLHRVSFFSNAFALDSNMMRIELSLKGFQLKDDRQRSMFD